MLAGKILRAERLALVALILNAPAHAQQTQVVLLGTGTPPADPDRSGAATAIVVNDTPYLVDFGAGVVRRAKSAVVDRGVAALDPVKLRVAFVTHLHSDHTVGYPDLILTPWVLGRRVPLEVYGPRGIAHMTEHVMEAYREDFATRTKDRNLYTVGAFPEGHAVNAHEIKPGVVYKDANVTVTAFATKHAMESYGYRFDTRGSQHRDLGRHQSDAGHDRRMSRLRRADPRSADARLAVAAARLSRLRRRSITPRRRSWRSSRSRRSRDCWFCITRRCRCVRPWTRSARRRPCC